VESEETGISCQSEKIRIANCAIRAFSARGIDLVKESADRKAALGPADDVCRGLGDLSSSDRRLWGRMRRVPQEEVQHRCAAKNYWDHQQSHLSGAGRLSRRDGFQGGVALLLCSWHETMWKAEGEKSRGPVPGTADWQ
jgi:hypothetical protein